MSTLVLRPRSVGTGRLTPGGIADEVLVTREKLFDGPNALITKNGFLIRFI